MLALADAACRHRPHRPSGRPARRAPFAGRSLCLRADQRHGPSGDARAGPAAQGPEALRLCLVLVGLWRQSQAALRHRRPGRPSGLALCRHQAGRRADDRDLQPPVRAEGDRPALFHGLRTVGPARHVAVHLRQGDPRGPHHRALPPGLREARLQLHRRHRGRHARGARQAGRRRPATGSTISAPRAARTSSTSSRCSRRRWAARPRSSSSPAIPSTCRKPLPTSPTPRATSAGRRRSRWKRASRSSWSGSRTMAGRSCRTSRRSPRWRSD